MITVAICDDSKKIRESMRKSLEEYEEKLHLIEKFTDAKRKMKEIDELAKASEGLTDRELREQITKIQNLAGDLVQNF